MLTLRGEHIYLRALEPEDLDFLYRIENDEEVWQVSETNAPYSKYVLKQYLENAHEDIFTIKQLRLGIVLMDTNMLIGFIDIFDFDPVNYRAGVGIIIDNTYRKKGVGREALQLVINYTSTYLNLHQLYANIGENNTASITLFEHLGFSLIGVKKDWTFTNGNFQNELLYQKLI